MSAPNEPVEARGLHGTNALLVLGLATLFPIARRVLDVALYTPLAGALVKPAVYKRNDALPKKIKSKMAKFSEAQWKLTTYSLFSLMGWWAVGGQPWLTDTRRLWEDWPHQEMTRAMNVHYACELAYYVATIFMLAVWEVRRKDHWVMMTHHWVAVVLISCSYVFNYTRAGCVTMLLHDVNDVLLEVAKSCNYCGWEAASTLFFGLFVAAWAVLRITCFPAGIIRTTLLEVVDELGYRPPYWGTFNVLLVMLYAIHLYWFRMILAVVWRKLSTGKVADVREDSDASDDDD